MAFNIQFLDREKTEEFRDEVNTRREKAIRWARLHPRISLLTTTLFVIALIYGLVPVGTLYFLPDFVVKQVIYALLGGVMGYYFGRGLYRRRGVPETEIVKEINLAQTPIVQRYRHLRGDFKKDMEFKHGHPIEERREDGIPVYNVIKVDFDDKVAYCSPWSDMSQAKMFETKEALRAQFLFNDELRKFGAEINMKIEQIVSQVEHDVANSFIRKLETVAHPEDIVKASKEGLPTKNLDIETPELEDILEDTGIENPQGLESRNQGGE